MLKITRLTDYALLVLCCLATRSDEILSSTKIANLVSLQLPTVSKLLKILVKSGLVESYRGSDGGYKLAKAAEFISVNDVISSIEGPIALTDCSEHKEINSLDKSDKLDGSDTLTSKNNISIESNINNNKNSCLHIANCGIRQPWQKINHAVSMILCKISIKDMAFNNIEL